MKRKGVRKKEEVGGRMKEPSFPSAWLPEHSCPLSLEAPQMEVGSYLLPPWPLSYLPAGSGGVAQLGGVGKGGW